MSSLRVERVYPHAKSLVWRALTDSDLMARWLMPNNFEPTVGHRFQFKTDPGPGFDGIVRCEVQELIEGQLLRISWVGGPIDTQVSFTLTEVEGGTRLIVVQTGFAGVRAWIVSRILAIGNRTIYGKRLPALLATLQSSDHPEGIAGPGCMTPEQSLWERLLRLFSKPK